MTAHLDSASANVDATTADIHKFVHRETTPARGTWNLIKSFLGIAAPVAQIGTALK